jgi:hypothetical protein
VKEQRRKNKYWIYEESTHDVDADGDDNDDKGLDDPVSLRFKYDGVTTVKKKRMRK